MVDAANGCIHSENNASAESSDNLVYMFRVIGMLIIQVISSGIIFFGIDATWSTFVTGAVNIVAVVLDRIIKYQRQKRADAQQSRAG